MQNRPSQTNHDAAKRPSAHTTLEMLDDALSKLEQRMGIGSSAPAPAPRRQDDDISAIRARQEALARSAPPRPLPQAAPSAGLKDEVARLREELNHEMSSTITQQFAAVREEMRGMLGQGGGMSSADLSDGFNRLTRELGLVASRVENSDMGSLRAEIDELKGHVAALAREDTLRDMVERWSVIEREIEALPHTLGSRDDLLEIAARITQINDALHGLPDSGALAAMEDQMRALAGAVESLASQNAAVSPDHLFAIDRRLDEISHAIAAVSVSGGRAEFDTAPFDRIEARLSGLARQVEENAGAGQSDSVEKRLMEIAERLGALHETVSAPPPANDAIDNVARRLEDIARRFDTETAQGEGVPQSMLDNLNSRFEEIAQRLDSHRASAEESGERLFQSLDARMEELARRIEDNERDSAHVPTFDHMERRIEEIAQMLSTGEPFPAAAPNPQDSRTLESIEAQIAALSEKLSGALPAADNSALADLAPRLVAITDQLAGGRDDMIAAARQAAEDVVSHYSIGASEEDRGMLAQLAGDLRGLEELARNSDSRNTRTFEAIHDTLVKVADRIAGLESSLHDYDPRDASAEPDMPEEEPEAAPVRKAPIMPPVTQIENVPPLDFAAGEETPSAEPRAERHPVSPAEAAVLAARAAETGETGPNELPQMVAARNEGAVKGQRGLLAGLRNAMSRGNGDTTETIEGDEDRAVFGKAGDRRAEPELSDVPLEPGTGGPDLAEIMKRVRAERDGPDAPPPSQSPEDDAGKSDFIAAARRAARAAAAEASVLDTGGKEDGKSGKKGRGLLAASRRPLMLGAGAILLALLAYPLVRGYLAPDETANTVSQVEEPAATVTETAPAAPTDEASAATDATDDIATDSVAAETIVPDTAMPAATLAETPAPGAGPAMQVMGPPAPEAAGNEEIAAVGMPVDETIETSSFETMTIDDVPQAAGPTALRQAAAEGDPKAMFVVGDRLMGSGPGAPDSDMQAADKWYEMSAELGFAPAQYRIGNAYEKGFGVDRDPRQAMTWYQLAAEQGNVSAMHNLAVLFATEVDGKRDMESAARWFLEAAELGVKDSQVNLGILSARGEGVPQDLVEAYKWLALAALAGDKDAEAKRDEVAKFMRPDQIETARGAVELWKVRRPDPAVNAVDMPEEWKLDQETTASVAPQDVDMQKAIRNIQGILNNAGYDAGTPDGIMGDRTRSAITAFQTDNGLAPTGEVDRALVDKLLEINKQS